MDGKEYWRAHDCRRKSTCRSSVRVGRETSLFILCRPNSQDGWELRQPVTRATKSPDVYAVHSRRREASVRW